MSLSKIEARLDRMLSTVATKDDIESLISLIKKLHRDHNARERELSTHPF